MIGGNTTHPATKQFIDNFESFPDKQEEAQPSPPTSTWMKWLPPVAIIWGALLACAVILGIEDFYRVQDAFFFTLYFAPILVTLGTIAYSLLRYGWKAWPSILIAYPLTVLMNYSLLHAMDYQAFLLAAMTCGMGIAVALLSVAIIRGIRRLMRAPHTLHHKQCVLMSSTLAAWTMFVLFALLLTKSASSEDASNPPINIYYVSMLTIACALTLITVFTRRKAPAPVEEES
ncbi:hypothetical protein D2E26_1234 [Bifidobacterium dolichotidis]|uniref:Uncharacterized protein n=1 Tax=Bifidobacterium dolichotidis TaxID=2306976 RepID=A0A430FQT2_9BIFI|nr:hypothetical protein [Bifidobacterium dolichotidis]RSX55180.1 hypothetical protein D2E26_1234 [Bifidobacterium dolichotidis]